LRLLLLRLAGCGISGLLLAGLLRRPGLGGGRRLIRLRLLILPAPDRQGGHATRQQENAKRFHAHRFFS
jgi:hypothetical protein